eukprot:gene19770-21704_t
MLKVDPATSDGLLSSTDLGNKFNAEFVDQKLRATVDESKTIRSFYTTLLGVPTIVTENKKSLLLATTDITPLDDCNHIEADTMLIYVMSTANSPIIIRATDTDVLILMVYVNTEMREHRWEMKIDRESYVNVGKICDIFCTDVFKEHIVTPEEELATMFHSVSMP